MFKSRKQVVSKETHQRKPLRLWPGIVAVILQWLLRFGLPLVVPGDGINQIAMIGGLLFGLVIIMWWAFFSRAPILERWGAIVLIIFDLIATHNILDKSIATSMMGMMFVLYSIPVLCLAFVVWAVATNHLSDKVRRVTMVLTILLSVGVWALLRTNGMTGDGHQDFAWRWTKTAEERLLSQTGDNLSTHTSVNLAANTAIGWPGFRGVNRDGIIHGIKIKTNWSVNPPVMMWRKPIGPGCSSFAVHGNIFYTQEQRGEEEMVSCYNLTTGQPLWKHSDKIRFYEAHAGPGPRSTPTLAGNRVYTLGATGILNVLDAGSGAVIWSRNAAADTKLKVLQWGFTGSPLVFGDKVIVALSGKLAAYDTASGKPIWFSPDGGDSYSSPHLAEIDGISQVIMMSKSGAQSLDPTSGKKLWKYSWPLTYGRILQPAVIKSGDFLFANETVGLSRVTVSNAQGKWSVKELWTSEEMKLYFNDFIIHKGHAYGFDGPSIACIDIKDGKRTWKGDRYRGWLLLLADQDLLIVLSEKGELALVQATPEKFREIARIPAIKGKTWNHPVLVGDVLLARNAEEMVAFKLSLAGS
jgi:outer membrane protein assembly factor BamB